ncbi:MAG: Asp-tRNA(Asn)/Glu-tRNA(Gln) amidotransferase subunit GatA [Patescibacteria group bacterium]
MTPKTIAVAAKALEAGELSAVELTTTYLDAIATKDEALNAYLNVDRDGALEAAKAADERRAAGQVRGALDGIPISVKDVIVTEGIPTTAASKLLDGYVPPYDATVVQKLKDAGAVILGKTNCDAWAHGSSTENSAYGPTRNPWDTSRVPGGSSGGSAAAVAAGLGLASIGTDTGGSIRQPAALTGTTGFKPTYGRVSRYGLIAMASSLDCPGPFTRTAEDAAILMAAIAGRDPLDATSLPDAPPAVPVLDDVRPLAGKVIGVPNEFFGEGLDPRVDGLVRQALRVYERLGATLKPISLPLTKYGIAVYYIVMPAEVSSNLARFDGIRYGRRAADATSLAEVYAKTRAQGFGTEAKRRIMMGTYVLSSGYYDAYYRRAMQVRRLLIDEVRDTFGQVDFIATPTAPTPAFKFGEKTNDPLQMYLSDVYTVTANLTGNPAISIPCGFVAEDGHELPVGLQLIGDITDDENVLRAAMAYQRETDWHKKEPA